MSVEEVGLELAITGSSTGWGEGRAPRKLGLVSWGCALTKSGVCLDFGVRLAGKRSSLEKSLTEEKPGAELGWGGEGWAPADPVVRDLLGAGEGRCRQTQWSGISAVTLGLHYAAPQEFI